MNAFTVKTVMHGLSIGFIVRLLDNDRFIVETTTGIANPAIVYKKNDQWQLEKQGALCFEPADVDALGAAIEKEINKIK